MNARLPPSSGVSGCRSGIRSASIRLRRTSACSWACSGRAGSNSPALPPFGLYPFLPEVLGLVRGHRRGEVIGAVQIRKLGEGERLFLFLVGGHRRDIKGCRLGMAVRRRRHQVDLNLDVLKCLVGGVLELEIRGVEIDRPNIDRSKRVQVIT